MMNTIKVNGAAGLGIYCHIPFCLKKCAYCDFSSFSCQSEETIRIYFEALHKEIRNFANENKNSILPMVDTIYFGGGTPSSVDAGQIETTLAILKEVFVIKADAEITIEINPGTLTRDKASRYQEAGINRASVGLQAWQDFLLQILGRVHSQADFIKTMEILKSTGFENFSVDVMVGLPGQKLADVMETLGALMAFSPTHLSSYSLILEPDTPMANWVEAGQLELPDEDEEREMHWAVDRFLKEQGYQHYEISSYCRPGYESRHNVKYWELVPYLGFGLGAHGYFKGRRYGNVNEINQYCELLIAGKSASIFEPVMEIPEMRSEWMFLGLRKLGGIRDDDFRACFGESFFVCYGEVINSLIADELLAWDGSVLKLTSRGQDFGNRVFMAFV
ncbi:MAG: coproporphyrinogen III oxidase [Candidatus Wallbacteria bacterium HGW-Wallbacteria-1]|uniref:Heme chaperone HemW n=1 Tax=Candidatus Wallbacteria bacterium HGW-Wallbacteria-1 TaxID=2013854 RepID=A0A2N1PGU0_9BACT|nr:MAG: coproporphyrinogen III oxidase [Candidatus Wallbacteria bacterium HGW-Wallbacteria-1]